MANTIFHQPKGSRTRKVGWLFGFITTTTSGTIDSAASTNCVGFSVTRTGAGVYRITLDEKYVTIINAIGTVFVSAWAAAKGGPIGRPKAVSVANGTIDIEFLRSDTLAAADVPDAAVINFEITVADSLLTR
jgi:hypothetical protein